MQSKYADELLCQHCGKPNYAADWPVNGDTVPFYNQTEPGKHHVVVKCPHCKGAWYVVWDSNPGNVERIERSKAEVDALLRRRSIGQAPAKDGVATAAPVNIKVNCPKCKKGFLAPAAIRGKKIKCKGCGETFVATGTPVPAVADKKGAAGGDDEWGVVKAYIVTKESEKQRCPYCAGELEEDQVVCLECGYNLQTRVRMDERVLESVTGADRVFWLLPGIACIFLFFFLAAVCLVVLWLGFPDLSFIGFRWIQAWQSTRIYGTIFTAFLMFFAARFAVKRLIFNNKVPDKEKKKKKKQ